ncbi:CocE/NonD family hydrolase C-terminal non-catalytic domain-containing protein, partial [Cribrihabitans sp. XS_ASV171]
AFFETGPLTEDLEIFGFPMLHTRVTSDVAQANLAAVLSLVAPDGKATLVTFGVLNLTHRNSHAEPEALPIGQPVEATLQLNVIGQRIPAGYRLRLALSQAYWPIIFPSPHKAGLTLTDTRLVLPSHDAAHDDPTLPEFQAPESATPVQTEVLRPGNGHRTLTLDYPTGTETYTRYGDTGDVRHLHTGITVHYESEDRFQIQPADPNSARMTCRWKKQYRREDWLAELDATVLVDALPDVWRVTA